MSIVPAVPILCFKYSSPTKSRIISRNIAAAIVAIILPVNEANLKNTFFIWRKKRLIIYFKLPVDS